MIQLFQKVNNHSYETHHARFIPSHTTKVYETSVSVWYGSIKGCSHSCCFHEQLRDSHYKHRKIESMSALPKFIKHDIETEKVTFRVEHPYRIELMDTLSDLIAAFEEAYEAASFDWVSYDGTIRWDGSKWVTEDGSPLTAESAGVKTRYE